MSVFQNEVVSKHPAPCLKDVDAGSDFYQCPISNCRTTWRQALPITNNRGRSLVASSKWSEDWGLFLNPSHSELLSVGDTSKKVWLQNVFTLQ